MSDSPRPDSTQLALMEMNQVMAAAADEQLRHLALAQDEDYHYGEQGTWIAILKEGDEYGPLWQEGDESTIHMRTYSLAGQLYEDVVKTVQLGKYQLPPAVDANFMEWYHGAQIRLYAPWYAAYGISGTETIPPYENVIIEIELQ